MPRKLKNIYHLFRAVAANFYYRFPGKKLIVIGVTGTDGKTTTVNLIHHILLSAGIKAAIISTLSSAHTTTPDSWKLQKFLFQSFKNGCTHAVLEISSHAIDQNRIWGIPFAVGVLTNVANNEHLDYHGTFENYQNTKLRFHASCKKAITREDWPQNFRFETSLLGRFNRENVLSAVAACLALGISKDEISRGVKNFEAPLGRLEVVAKKPFIVIVDFAHTPQAFEAVLPVAKSLRRQSTNKLIHIFGATGDRDKSKRPIMAAIAAKHDDFILLTHEDTYSEDPEKIISELEEGLKTGGYKNYEKISGRKTAIQKALQMAKPGDVVLLTGVGHQRSMNISGHEIPWNEPEIIKEILNK